MKMIGYLNLLYLFFTDILVFSHAVVFFSAGLPPVVCDTDTHTLETLAHKFIFLQISTYRY